MALDMPKVLVTGANGFVGRHLTPELVRAGWAVRRAVRISSNNPDDFLISSISGNTNWTSAFKEVEAVVHLAARVHHPREEYAADLYRSTNTEGTLHLARCAAEAGVRHLVFLSTVLVNGRST